MQREGKDLSRCKRERVSNCSLSDEIDDHGDRDDFAENKSKKGKKYKQTGLPKAVRVGWV